MTPAPIPSLRKEAMGVSREVRAGLNINQSLFRKRKEVNGKAIRKF
jgi:hypothetical protein